MYTDNTYIAIYQIYQPIATSQTGTYVATFLKHFDDAVSVQLQ